ncbi:MAG TPA: carbohydrate porin [Acetobacteraceae bacterium]|nr:carbohydrate porin [Acetobacteraceae bacterium]
MLGDWGGLRPELESRGIYLQFSAVAEFAGNTRGAQQGATSANQIAVSADIDWQELAGPTGFSTHVIFVNRSGANDSHLFGDNVSPVQEIYGAGEMILEVNYNIHVYCGLDFGPEFQYVFRPNAQGNIHNAAVFGFKASGEF